MAAAQIIIDIDDDNFDAETWAAALEWFPLNEKNPEDVGTKALKLAYFEAKLARFVNHKLSLLKRKQAARAASRASTEIDLNA